MSYQDLAMQATLKASRRRQMVRNAKEIEWSPLRDSVVNKVFKDFDGAPYL